MKDIMLKEIRKSLKKDPNNSSIYCSWGQELSSKKRYNDANNKFKKAILLNPKYSFAYCCWGKILVKQKKYSEAIKKYKVAIEINSLSTRNSKKNCYAYFYWGIALLKLKKYDESIEAFKNAISVNPNISNLYYSRYGNNESFLSDIYCEWGKALFGKGKYEECIKIYEKIIERDPHHKNVYYEFGNILFKQEKYYLAYLKFEKSLIFNFSNTKAKTKIRIIKKMFERL